MSTAPILIMLPREPSGYGGHFGILRESGVGRRPRIDGLLASTYHDPMTEVKPEPLTVAQNGRPVTPGSGIPRSRAVPRTLPALTGMDPREMEHLLLSLGEKPYRGRQIAEWIYARGAADFAGMTNLPAALRERLA